MKLRTIIFSLIALVFAWQACDKIDSPYKIQTSNIIDTGNVVKKVILIEEFTGQRCPNCPEMAVAIKSLKETFDDKVVVVAMHAGFFAIPIGQTFSTDYRTPASTELDQFFDIGSSGYPKGLVNRTGYPSGTHRLESAELAGRIVELLEGDTLADIGITHNYSTISKELEVEINVSALAPLQKKLLLSVFITENDIVSPQQNDTEVITDYVHKYVLRTSLNGTWGDQLSDGSTIDPGTSFKQSYQTTLSENWNDENCNIVAFVYDGDTKEVLQAAEVKIR
ncbi:MAG: Omp28 family outer membrane lipoprotein [Bacteroidales bacterium]|nr:Omp28 family outer membrane lipoprotein [Bacteroidales bacterium]